MSLVSETHRERANAIQQMAFPLAGVVAPVLTGLVYAWAGLSAVILIDLVTFLVAVVAVSLSHILQPQVTAEGLADRGPYEIPDEIGHNLSCLVIHLSSTKSLSQTLLGMAFAVLLLPFILTIPLAQAAGTINVISTPSSPVPPQQLPTFVFRNRTFHA